MAKLPAQPTSVKLPTRLRRDVEREAKASGRSRSSEIVILLEEALVARILANGRKR